MATQRRFRLAAVAVVVAVGIGVAFIATPRRSGELAAGALVVAASAAAGVDPQSDSIADFRGLPAGIALESATAGESDEARRRAGEVELCGVGLVRPETLQSVDTPWAAAAAAAVQKLVARLLAEGSERARVTAWMVQRAADIDVALRAGIAAAQSRCGADEACLADAGKRQLRALGRAASSRTEAIARAASVSRDPYVYAVAVQACRWFVNNAAGTVGEGRLAAGDLDAPACQLISVEQWTRIDPTNAVPWLHLAEEARSRRDAAAVDEAMHRVATAATSRVDGGRFYGEAMDPLPGTASDFEKAQVSQFVFGIVAAWQLPKYQVVTQWCAAPLLQDSNRWQACDATAQGLLAHASTFIERRVALRVGERARWPAERIAKLREEDDALSAAQRELDAGPDPLGCRAATRTHGFWMQAARDGEVEAARALALASGNSMQSLAAETRTKREEVAKAAAVERAASASESAASAS